MSDKKYYVVCETGCMVEGMTAEQILAAIAEATGNAVVPTDKAYITMVVDQNTGNNLKLWRGTRAQFNAIEELASDVYYIITDDHTPNEAYEKANEAALAVEAMRETIDGIGRDVEEAKGAAESLNTHTANTSNPHGVTKSQVGLGKVNNNTISMSLSGTTLTISYS